MILPDENGWAFPWRPGKPLVEKKAAGFLTPETMASPKLLPLIKSLGQFEIDERESGRRKTLNWFIVRVEIVLINSDRSGPAHTNPGCSINFFSLVLKTPRRTFEFFLSQKLSAYEKKVTVGFVAACIILG